MVINSKIKQLFSLKSVLHHKQFSYTENLQVIKNCNYYMWKITRGIYTIVYSYHKTDIYSNRWLIFVNLQCKLLNRGDNSCCSNRIWQQWFRLFCLQLFLKYYYQSYIYIWRLYLVLRTICLQQKQDTYQNNYCIQTKTLVYKSPAICFLQKN